MKLSLILFVCLSASFVAAKPTDLQAKHPANFDARKKFTKCPVIGEVSDQGSCKGAGWAISIAAHFAGQVCIASKGKQASLRLSALELLQCVPKKQVGANPMQTVLTPRSGVCDTSDPRSWSESSVSGLGLVTGGSFGSKSGCKPYPFDHKTDVSTIPFKCKQTCDNRNYSVPFDKDGYKVRRLNMVVNFKPHSAPEAVYEAISNNGSVIVSMDVYESFAHLSGDKIYRQGKNESKPLARHGVRVIGWGSEAGEDYWLVINSYGTKWGNNGTFRVRRGHNDFRLEESFAYFSYV